MNDFWDDVLKDKLADKPINAAWEDLSKEASFRPIIFIGAGGFGCSVIRDLKVAINKLIPNQAIKAGFAFIGVDTQPREDNDALTAVEYTSLAVGISPSEVSRKPMLSPYLGWYKDLTGNWDAGSILAANKVRAVGRIAFLFPTSLKAFYDNLNSAFGRVNGFREKFGIKAFPKVYVINSLAGGTGAGLFIDLLAITGNYLKKQVGEKYLLQAILATPDALEDEANTDDYQELYANTYVSLKEIFHFIRGKEELMPYKIDGTADEKLKVGSKYMPRHIFLITNRNKDGKHIINTMDELQALVKNYLLFEIQTPLKTKGGTPKVQDGENRRFDTLGYGNMPRVFSSIGVVRFGFPYDEIADLYTYLIMGRAIRDELSRSNNMMEIDKWIECQGLTEVETDQLQETLRKDQEGHSIRIPLDVEGDLTKIKRAEYGKACKTLKDSKVRAIKEIIKPKIEGNASVHLQKAILNLQATFEEKIRDASIGEALYFIRSLNDLLKKQKEALTQELDEGRKKLAKAEEKVDKEIKNVSEVAISGFFYRKSRIQCAVTSYGGDLEAMLNQQLIVWAQEEGITLYNNLNTQCDKLINDRKVVEDAFLSRQESVKDTIIDLIARIDRMAEIDKRSDGNRFSIVNSSNVRDIYNDFFSDEVVSSIALRARKNWREKSLLNDTLAKDSDWLPNAIFSITDEVHDKIKGLDIMKVIDRFYAEKKDRSTLMEAVKALGSPLYPMDENIPVHPVTDRVIATHPSIREKFKEFFAEYKDAQEGMSDAYFSTTHEVIVYTIAHGYVAESLSRLNYYKAQYDYLQNSYEQERAKKNSCRPYHAWAGANEWDELIPKPPGEEASYKLFIVARSLNKLYPGDKNQSFIFNKGSNYYLIADKGKSEKLGNSLETAIEKFNDCPEWQKKIEQEITAKIDGVGTKEIKQRIENEYMLVVDAEIESCENGGESNRLKILRELRTLLFDFTEKDLKEGRV